MGASVLFAEGSVLIGTVLVSDSVPKISFLMILPEGPEPTTLDKSIFFSEAIFLARGETKILSVDGSTLSPLFFFQIRFYWKSRAVFFSLNKSFLVFFFFRVGLILRIFR